MKSNHQKLTVFLSLLILIPFFLTPNVRALENETIDDFSTHPAVRWHNQEDVGGMTDTCTNGIFTLADTGDGTTNYQSWIRGLNALEEKIIIEFRLIGDGNGASTSDGGWFEIFFTDNDTHYAGGSNSWSLRFWNDNDNTTWSVMNAYTGGTTEIGKAENNTWYVLEYEYDLFRYKCELELSYRNGSRIFKFDQDELFDNGDNVWLQVTKSPALSLRFGITTNGAKYQIDLNYIDAPFNEKQWDNTGKPSSGNYNANNWYSAYTEDNIDDISTWELVVPFFDAMSGTVSSHVLSDSALAGGEYARMYIRILGVDHDDGGLHEILEIYYRHEEQIAPSVVCNFDVNVIANGATTIYNGPLINVAAADPALEFSIGLTEDRQKLGGQLLLYSDYEAGTTYTTASFQINVRAISADIRDEFVLIMEYDFDYDGDTEWGINLYDFDLIERGIGEDIMGFIGGVVGFGQGLVDRFFDIFFVLFRWLATALGVIFGTIGAAISFAVEALEPFLSAIGDAINDLVAYLLEIGEYVLTALIDYLGDILEDLFEWLATAVDLIADFFFAVFWDSWGGFNLLEILEIIVDNFFSVIAGIPQLIIDLMSWVELFAVILIALWWFRVVFLAFAEASFNPFEGTSNMIDCMFADIFPLGMLYIPGGLVMIPLTFFMILSPAGSVFFIW